MWIKSYIKYRLPELLECDLLIKHGKIQEVNFSGIKGMTPFENNSELSDNIEILKTYKQDSTNNFCKYFIKKSIEKEVVIMYLSLTKLEYFKLQWQLKKYLIQSKDLKMEVLKYVVIGLIGFFAAVLYQKYNDNVNMKNKIEIKKPNG